MKKVAIDIETKIWAEIIRVLRKEGWIVTAKYWGYDAGIDADYWCLRKGLRKIEFAWSNWTEGEIRAKESLLSKIEEKHKIKFKYGEPSNLKRSVIVTFKLQSLPLWILNRFNFLDNKL
ncbi:hypothetical protein [Cyclobacterium amurskyense]|uniref:Uncharacterized protein n=1 Tax=Cyclobacterium amurskyense TaxID=320787 RepID=A0A0H4PE44_9BACT|nr:hypothetical protein [Cyclobacterium amurskyense]AKP51395.1 hypothetical protein CA2015_1968 [Cyclobacterium amurskyense]|tara:strand:+ start:10316 stop:10672 length:357 start_codon:yes stop_codon:yes gene_type:complete